MLMQVLDRPGDAWDHCRSLLLDNHEPRSRQRRHVRTSDQPVQSAAHDGVVVEGSTNRMPTGASSRSTMSCRTTSRSNQLLSPFLLSAFPQLDADDDRYALALLALVEAVVDIPSRSSWPRRTRPRTRRWPR